MRIQWRVVLCFVAVSAWLIPVEVLSVSPDRAQAFGTRPGARSAARSVSGASPLGRSGDSDSADSSAGNRINPADSGKAIASAPTGSCADSSETYHTVGSLRGAGMAPSGLAELLAGGTLTPQALGDAISARLGASRDKGGSGLDEIPQAEVSCVFWAEADSAGDLNGDGAGDVLMFEEEVRYLRSTFQPDREIRFRLRARSGRDGSEFYATPAIDAGEPGSNPPRALYAFERDARIYWQVGDVFEGDGPEVLVYESWFDRSYLGSVQNEIRQRLWVYSARTGAERWHASIRGSITNLLGVTSVRGLVTGLYPIEDATGDGKGDLFITSVDSESIENHARYSDIRTQAITLDSETGAEVARVSLGSSPEFQDVTPVGDVDGDEAPDLLVWDRARVALLSAVDGTPHWSTPQPGYTSYSQAYPLSLTGSSTPDVVVITRNEGEEEPAVEGYAVLRGTDGLPAWTRSVEGGWFVEAGDLLARGAGDVYLLSNQGGELAVEALSGLDGSTIFRHVEVAEPTDRAYIWIRDVADLNGDAAAELFYETGVRTDDDDEYQMTSQFAFDPIAGSRIWLTGPRAQPEWRERIGDVDGDGLSDMRHWALDGDEQVVSFERGFDLSPLWSLRYPNGYDYGVLADLTGDAIPEYLVVYIDDWPPRRNFVSAYTAPGVLLWSIDPRPDWD